MTLVIMFYETCHLVQKFLWGQPHGHDIIMSLFSYEIRYWTKMVLQSKP